MAKVDRCDEAFAMLDYALALNKEYVKAHMKKGDILL